MPIKRLESNRNNCTYAYIQEHSKVHFTLGIMNGYLYYFVIVESFKYYPLNSKSRLFNG